MTYLKSYKRKKLLHELEDLRQVVGQVLASTSSPLLPRLYFLASSSLPLSLSLRLPLSVSHPPLFFPSLPSAASVSLSLSLSQARLPHPLLFIALSCYVKRPARTCTRESYYEV